MREAEHKRRELAQSLPDQQEYAAKCVENCLNKLKKQHIEAIEMLNNEWQDFLCGLMPEEHSDEAESGTSDTEAQENTADMPELRERVNAIAKELMEILDKKQ